MKILGIVGSKRKNGNTSTLVMSALESAKGDGIETEVIFLGDYSIKGCTGCEGCRDTYKCVINDDMQKIYPLLMESDAIILGSPTYFYNVTADVKVFIDRCYCFEVMSKEDRSVWMGINEVLGGRYASVIAVCEQHSPEDMGYTGEAMAKPLEALGYRVIDIVKVLGLFERGKAKENKTAIKQSQNAGKRLFKTLQLNKDIREKLLDFKLSK
ncbi:flavodoxin family protein [Ilyobacter polytropus]|uniref:NADPH-dependent FMN reductase n=1 Tax=Ilyobacter polytropus (strain ATCC 51220 / DSM 2926 / LMG 16218 / CuHBu1) TaxID=572544 RepID=E3H8J4_ILYPC|nr:flavodoxin family protein [Ilyobacter polytropus]ADO82976.1 NADPH-dependent FMN reductase [Ilyobacter polytropus DSM 2926]